MNHRKINCSSDLVEAMLHCTLALYVKLPSVGRAEIQIERGEVAVVDAPALVDFHELRTMLTAPNH